MFYLDLFSALNEAQVRYMLVGGLAMNLHGIPRMTMDVDLVLAMDDANLDRFIRCCEHLKLRPLAPVPLADLKRPEQRERWISEKHMIAFGLQGEKADVPTVDVLITPQPELDDALNRAHLRLLGQLHVLVASVDDLILMKRRAGRRQDLDDIEHLERLRG